MRSAGIVVIVMVLLVDLNLARVLLRSDWMLVGMLVPIRMMRIYPIGVMVVPPVAIVPFVMFIEIAFIAPFGMTFGPLGMVTVEPAAIVIVPPVSFVPRVVGSIVAPSFVASHLSPGVRMVLHELL